MASANSFFHYRDAEGVDVIVQRWEEIPAKYRAQAERLDLTQKPAPVLSREVRMETPALPATGVAPAQEFWSTIHWPSFVVGAVISLAAGLFFPVLLRRRSRVVSLLVGALAMMAFGIGYLTFLRHQVGLRSTGLATPATIIDDARAAASTAQKRYQQQEKTLDQINNMR
jgi:hypothetical protein